MLRLALDLPGSPSPPRPTKHHDQSSPGWIERMIGCPLLSACARGVAARRRVAAAHVSTAQADAQVAPFAAAREALLAARRPRRGSSVSSIVSRCVQAAMEHAYRYAHERLRVPRLQTATQHPRGARRPRPARAVRGTRLPGAHRGPHSAHRQRRVGLSRGRHGRHRARVDLGRVPRAARSRRSRATSTA